MTTQAYAVSLGGTVLAGLTGIDTQMNPEIDNEVGIGSLFPQFAILRSVNPKMLFQARGVAAALALTGSVGADIESGSELVATYAKLAAGLPAAGSVHTTYTAGNGLLLPRRLSCAHRADAVLDMEALLLSADGAADPFAISTATLPTVPRDNQRHTLWTNSVAGEDLGCVENVSIDFGNSAATRGCNSNIFDSRLSQRTTQTVITITGLNSDVFSDTNIPLKGKPAVHTDTNIRLRKYAPSGSSFVDAATAEHVEITASGMAVCTSHSGNLNEDSQITIQITCDWDGSNAPVTINPAFGTV